MIMMSIPILPRSFNCIPCHFIGFLGLWPFNYPLTFTLYFSTLNLMVWHEINWDISYDVSRTYVSISPQYYVEIQSYWPAKLGTEFGH